MLAFQTENRKQKPSRCSLILLSFTHGANGCLSFVCLLTKNKGSYPFAYGLKGLNRLAHLCP